MWPLVSWPHAEAGPSPKISWATNWTQWGNKKIRPQSWLESMEGCRRWLWEELWGEHVQATLYEIVKESIKILLKIYNSEFSQGFGLSIKCPSSIMCWRHGPRWGCCFGRLWNIWEMELCWRKCVTGDRLWRFSTPHFRFTLYFLTEEQCDSILTFPRLRLPHLSGLYFLEL